MSGHSKWSTIKRGKAVNDAKKSQVFTKIARLITVASKQGGGDPNTNPSLRLAIEKAKHARMPKDNIQRAINKGLGAGSEGSAYEEVIYEAFGPNGEAFYIKGITDNKNRTVAEIRSMFTSAGGSLGGIGSTSYIFKPNPSAPNFVVGVDKEAYEKLNTLVRKLELSDDVQEVFVNYKLK